jgi:hypothetical protein
MQFSGSGHTPNATPGHSVHDFLLSRSVTVSRARWRRRNPNPNSIPPTCRVRCVGSEQRRAAVKTSIEIDVKTQVGSRSKDRVFTVHGETR